MKTAKEDNMTVLSEEKSKLLAQETGWTLKRAEGYVEGERYRRLGLPLSSYQSVGIDVYAQGFRAGYYQREVSDSAGNDEKIAMAG